MRSARSAVAFLAAACLCSAARGQFTLFEDTFDSAVGPQWTSITGTAVWDAGTMRLVPINGSYPRGAVVSTHDGETTWNDYAFDARIDPVQAGAGNWVRSGVLFRTSDLGVDPNGYGPDASYYRIDFTNPGDPDPPRVYLSRFLHGVNTDLLIQPWTGSEGAFDLHVLLSGSHIMVSTNGVPIIDIHDVGGPTYGGIGFQNIWESQARYDNVSVWLPTPGAITLFGPGVLVACRRRR